MKKLLLFSFIPFSVLAQKKDTIRQFLDENLMPTKKENAQFYGVALKRNDHWQLYAIYPDTTPVINAFFKDKKLTIKDGQYTVYYPKNRKAAEGLYMENKKNGRWLSWYENGQIKDSGTIWNDRPVGNWKVWHENGQLSIACQYKDLSQTSPENNHNITSSDQGIKDGNYQSWYPNGKTESIGQYKEDMLAGEWQWFYENGNQSTKELYEKGKITSMVCFDSSGKETGDFCSIVRPATVVGIGNYREYIKDSLRWPLEALQKNIQGKVNVKLEISKTGDVLKMDITSDQPILKKAVEDLLTSFHKWYPAVSHNRPTEWVDEFDIPFLK